MLLKQLKFILSLVLCGTLCTPNLQAQAPTEKSVFWEITPKQGGKKSYLYGTMHVSKKVAFRLPNALYEAIKSVDKVGLESNPEYWNEELERSEDLQDLFGLANAGMAGAMDYNKSYYAKLYGLNPVNNEVIKSQLSYEPHSANELLFRSYGLQKNFEEDTYLDLYIFKTGKKYSKPIVSLEDIVWSTTTVVKATFHEDNRKSTRTYEGNLATDLEDAYRTQDLQKIDSIQRASAPSDAYLQGMLYVRNDTMLKNICAIMEQGQSVFAAVGAAHLAGDKGLLQAFKKLGYTIKPIFDASQLDPSSQILALDSVYLPVAFSPRVSADSTLQFLSPVYTSRNTTGNKVEYLSTDMTNGVYYYIGRLYTFQQLGGLTAQDIEQKFDSLLFENTKGTIINKKKETHQGYPCIRVTSKTKDGKIHRQKIIITPFEILFCKVVAKENYFKSNPSDTFLNTIRIQYRSQARPELPDAEVQMPTSITDNPFSKISFNGPNVLVQGIDQENDYFQFLRNYTVRQVEHEEDSFHVNMAGYFFMKENKLTEQSHKNGFTQQQLCFADFTATNTAEQTVHLRVISKGSSLYYLVVVSKNKNKATALFQSFQVKNDTRSAARWHTDTTHHFTFRTHLKPLGGSIADALFAQYKEAEAGRKRKSLYTGIFSDPDFGYQFTINLVELNKFEAYPTIDSFWNAIYQEYISTDELESKLVIRKKTWAANNQNYMLIETTDTNTNNISVDLMATTGNQLLELLAFRDTTQSSYRFIDTAIQSFQFSKTEPSVLTQSKLDSFLFYMTSKDSTTKDYFTKNSQYLNLLAQDESRLIQLLDTSDNLNKRDEIYAMMVYALDQYKKPTTLDFVKKLYKRNEENSERQVFLLNLLAYMNDTASTLLFKELITEMPPLEFEEDSDPMNHYFDTLSLGRLLMPDIMQLTDFDDYKYDVIYLCNELLKAKRIDSSIYEQKVNFFTLKGKEEIRRKTSQKSSLEVEEDKAEEDKEEDKTSSTWSSIGSDFSLTNEEENYSSKISFSEFYLIRTYANLLKPYQHKDNVKEFFKKIDSTNNKDLRFDMAIQNMKDKQPFDGAIIKEYGKLPKYKYPIIHDFYFNKMIEKIPFNVQGQQDVAKARIVEKAEIGAADTIQFVDKIWVSTPRDKGYVYVFRHKKQKDKEYLYDLMGLFEKDEKQLVPARSITITNVDLEKKTKEEFFQQLGNQFRVAGRRYITPAQMIEQEDSNNRSYLDILRNFGNDD
jgi:uncharacterized protein YbaP (TraB family)